MYIPVILLLLIVVIAVSSNETRKSIVEIIVGLVRVVIILAIILAFILAVIAVLWFPVNWLWIEFPSEKAHIVIGLSLGICGIAFIAGLFGYNLTD